MHVSFSYLADLAVEAPVYTGALNAPFTSHNVYYVKLCININAGPEPRIIIQLITYFVSYLETLSNNSVNSLSCRDWFNFFADASKSLALSF